MDNLSFENVAVGAIIVSVFNLIIVLLVKTETILKYIERIKGVIGLDYKNRARRSDDELRIYKKHSTVAKERVRHSFVTAIMWNTKWVWNWDDKFEPINIKGHCLGNSEKSRFDDYEFECEHPIEPFYYPNKNKKNDKSNFIQLSLTCSNINAKWPHTAIRASFDILKSIYETCDSNEAFEPIIKKAIIAERDERISNEIKKLRLQFWR